MMVITMNTMNDSMKQLLQKSEEEDIDKLNQISESVVNGAKLVKDCIIFGETDKLDETKIDFSRILKYVKDCEYYGAAEPPVRSIKSQCSGGTEPL